MTRDIRSLVGLGLGLGLGLGGLLGASQGNPRGPPPLAGIKSLYKNPIFHYVHISGKTRPEVDCKRNVYFFALAQTRF